MERASEIQRERGGGGYTSYSPALPASPGFGIFRQCSSSPSLGATVRRLIDACRIHLPNMAGAVTRRRGAARLCPLFGMWDGIGTFLIWQVAPLMSRVASSSPTSSAVGGGDLRALGGAVGGGACLGMGGGYPGGSLGPNLGPGLLSNAYMAMTRETPERHR